MTHPYVHVLLAMAQQDELARRAARHQPGPTRRSGASGVRRALTRLHRRRQLGHATTAARAPLGCVA